MPTNAYSKITERTTTFSEMRIQRIELKTMLRIWIQIASELSSYVETDPYSRHGTTELKVERETLTDTN